MTRLSPTPLLIVCLLYLGLGALFAVRTPDWQAPDEPAHYNYVAQVATQGCCPVIEDGDWDSGYLDVLKAERFAPALLSDLTTVQYEDHQPPLYYLLMSIVYAATNGSLIALRLATVFIGLTVVLYAYICAWLIFPRRPGAALGAAALVACLPQFLAISASVNNDALSWSLIGLTLVGCLAYLRSDALDLRTELLLGVIVGLALLTKVSAIFLLGVVPVVILLRWLRPTTTLRPPHVKAEPPLLTLVKRVGAFLLPALLLAGIWWGRNLATYGIPDLFGLAAHDRVVVGQLRTETLLAEIGSQYWTRALETTFQSFFGQLGWMALPLPAWIYGLLLLVIAAALVGWLVGAAANRQPLDPVQRETLITLALVGGLAVAQFIYYNTEFVQFQGRYLYTALIPFALLIAGGLDGWLRGGAARLRSLPPALSYAPVALIVLLVPLNLWLVWRVLPGLAP